MGPILLATVDNGALDKRCRAPNKTAWGQGLGSSDLRVAAQGSRRVRVMGARL